MTVVIPVHERDKDADWVKQAVASFPEGTPYLVAVNDGDVAGAVNAAVEQAATKWVLPFGDDAAHPMMLEGLLSVAFNCQVVYPEAFDMDERLERLVEKYPAVSFCGHRLLSDFYIPYQSLVLRNAWLELGGWRQEAAPLEGWDMFVRGWRAGWRFKPANSAAFYRRLRDGSRTMEFDKPRLREVVVGDDVPDFKATFYYQATHACAYLRCILPARHLPGVARPDLYAQVLLREGVSEAQQAEDVEKIAFPFHAGDAAVMQFAGDATWALMTHALQDQGVRVLVEVDDNYLYHPGRKIGGKSNWGAKIGQEVHTYQGHRSIVKWADGVIVTTERLAQSYRKFNSNVYVIPNPVDPVDWAHVKRNDDGVFRIGWFASRSHQPDIKLVRAALKWASEQPDVEVLVMGIDPKFPFPYGQLPWVDDLDTYRMLLGLVDVGLAPVVPSSFSVFRSDVKASEYTMGGAAVVCSDVAPYADWRHEETCFKASSADDFKRYVQHLVGNRDEARQMAAEARRWVDGHRDIRKLVPLWEEALGVKAALAAAA